MENVREAGILMPVASLPSDYGVGDFGPQAYRFADCVKEMQAAVWQILPLNPLGYGNSPYQPYSSMAGDELYISLDLLYKEGLLKEKPKAFRKTAEQIDYMAVREYKEPYLREAFQAFQAEQDKAYQAFIDQEWVFLYGVFIAMKKQNGMCCWTEWENQQKNWIKTKDRSSAVLQTLLPEVGYQMFLQYLFYRQWMDLKHYVNELGIKIMGDVPFYVGLDSLDVWEDQQGFQLDSEGYPVVVAGVPPDYFSKTGQRWGNPVYNWEYLKNNHYDFWINRLGYSKKLYDIIRIDHFRAFDTYWEIPAACLTAIEGEWKEAPGYEFFEEALKRLPGIQIVAEDLGELRQQVIELRDHFHFPGMKILQFVFDPTENNNKGKDRFNMILYTGTHDNQTIRGWYDEQEADIQNGVDAVLKRKNCWIEGNIGHSMIRYLMQKVSWLAILPVQDVLNLGDEARLNIPGTVGGPNWGWRLDDLGKLEAECGFMKEEIEQSQRAAKTAEIVKNWKIANQNLAIAQE